VRDELTGFFYGVLPLEEWKSQYRNDREIWHYRIGFRRRNRKRCSRFFWESSNVKPRKGIEYFTANRITKVVCEVKGNNKPVRYVCRVCGLVPVVSLYHHVKNDGLCKLCWITRKHFERRADAYLSVLQKEGKSLYVRKSDYLDWCRVLDYVSCRLLCKRFLTINQPLLDIVSDDIVEAITSSPKAQNLFALLLAFKLEQNTERKINGKPTKTDITSTSVYRWVMLKLMANDREFGCGNGECGDCAIQSASG
jgi:hypothetical protein